MTINRPLSADLLKSLDDRSREIFRSIVETYLESGDPLGSRNLARMLPMALSAASVRNVMSDLEDLGLIYSPHISAGRLPTQKGLRFFVDAFMQIGDLQPELRATIDSKVGKSDNHRQVETVLTEASQMLSGMTRGAGLVIAAKSDQPIRHIEFIRLDPQRALVVLVGGNDQVENRIMELPAGSTAVDFAYAVHTDVGNSCVACRISRRLAPLSEPLESGQTVEIITTPGAQPNPAWLSFVVTGKARSNIRHYLKNQRESESIALGRRLLNKSLAGHGTQLEKLNAEQVQELLQQLNVNELNTLLSDIGLGNRMAHIVAQKMFPEETREIPKATSKDAKQASLAIRGSEGMVMSYAKCCYPIPGDPIVGHISSGRGMVIHTETCNNIAEIRQNPEKVVSVRWDPDVEGEFAVEIRVELENERGIIAKLATAITSKEANIERISTVERDARFSIVNLLLNVRNRIHLARVMKHVRLIKPVTRVARVKSRKLVKPIKGNIAPEALKRQH